MDKSIKFCQAIESKISSDILKPVASSSKIGLPAPKTDKVMGLYRRRSTYKNQRQNQRQGVYKVSPRHDLATQCY